MPYFATRAVTISSRSAWFSIVAGSAAESPVTTPSSSTKVTRSPPVESDSCFAAAASRPVDWADSATEETSRCISSLAREVNRASNTKAAATVQISSPRPSTSAMLILIFFFICQISSGRGQPWLLAPIKR